MKIRTLVFVFCVLGFLSVLTSTTVLSHNSIKPLTTSRSITKLRLKDQTLDPDGTINGAKHPEKIPDRIAYAVLFRLIGGHNTEEEKNRILSYVKQMLGCKSCGKGKIKEEELQAYNNRIDSIVNAADEFQQQVGVLDKQVQEIVRDNWPRYTSEVRARLSELQRRKEAIINEIVFSLQNRLDSSGRAKLRKHLDERVKRKIKIIPPHQHPTFE
jgi:hypothetical protein